MCAVYEGGMNIVNGIGAPVDFEPLAYECDWGMSYCGDGLDFTPEQLEELRNRPFEWDSFLKDDFEYMYPRHFLACEQAKRVSKAYLRAIIEVHKATKGRGEDLYPDDLQNLLLTASRTIGIIATYLDGLPKAKSTDDSEPLGALLKDLHASESLCQEVRATARIIDPVEAISDDLRFKTFKAYERKVFMALLPLLVYYKHIKYSSEDDNKALLNLEYEGFPRETDDAATEVEDTKSIASEDTLLGTPEEKEKSKEYETSIQIEEVQDVQEIRAKSYLCGLIRLSTSSTSVVTENPKPKPKPVPGVFSKLTSAVTPAFIKAKQKIRHEQKIWEVLQFIKRSADDGTLDNRARWDNPLAVEAITQTDILGHAAGLSEGNPHFVKWLLDRGAPVNGPLNGKPGNTPLGRAVRTGTPEACETLVKAGATVSGCIVSSWDSEEPLAHAVKWRRPEIVKVLLKHGAFDHEVRKLYEDGGEELETTLHTACANTDAIKVLEVLLQDPSVIKHIDVRAGPKLNTPLHYAAGSNNLPAINLLLAAGANIESRNLRLSTPLHWAIKHRYAEAATHLIRQGGADVNAPRVRLEPPLKYAVGHRSREIVEALVAHGAKIDERTSEGKAALHSAAAHESTAVVRSLLDAGAEVNVRSAYGSTPLFLASQNGRIATAKLLLERGADAKLGRLGHKSTKEHDPKYIAKRGNNWEVVRLLECWERGEEYRAVDEDAEVEKNADDHECSWEYWFEKYIVKVHERELAGI